MAESKSDPRALRTRKLIMDSFIILSEQGFPRHHGKGYYNRSDG